MSDILQNQLTLELDSSPNFGFSNSKDSVDDDDPPFEQAINGLNEEGLWEAGSKEIYTLQLLHSWTSQADHNNGKIPFHLLGLVSR